MHTQYNLPWVIIGDFNEILYLHEKKGGNPRSQRSMQAFRDALADCGLEDLGCLGDTFTWRQGRIRERLDRSVANEAWAQMHPGATLKNLEFMRSYHRPILLDMEAQLAPNYDNRDPKRFEAKWFHEQKFREVVQRALNDAAVRVPGVGVLGKLGFLHGEMHAWDDAVLKTPKKRIRQAQRDLDNALSGPMNDENEAIAKQKAALIELLLEQQEVHWLQ
ncbi:uncharacterized protein [Lolium perenne]|uniref:uncharacterized protein n=1 Tax=Lolium perenne TaxID=4522 RepID=UPI003A99084D